MTTPNPITPPPELVQQWKRTAPHPINEREHYYYITLCAAQWGADQELEALLVWLRVKGFNNLASDLLAARRPKPPTRKERALKSLDGLALPEDAFETIRFALEALND
jgi:hypothetical protein